MTSKLFVIDIDDYDRKIIGNVAKIHKNDDNECDHNYN